MLNCTESEVSSQRPGQKTKSIPNENGGASETIQVAQHAFLPPCVLKSSLGL